jgi:putative ABC transport system permease protein
MLQDLKNACRELVKSRWFTFVTVLTLALGIGANTAIFGVVNRLLLSSLPYPDSDRLVYLRAGTPQSEFGLPTLPAVVAAWREARSLDGIAAYEFRTMLAHDDRGARIVRGYRITPGLPALLGVAPQLGRAFTAADAEAGAPAVVVLSHATWQNDFGGSSDVLGRALTLDDVSHVVVGVMPPGWDAFIAPGRPELWFPLSIDAAAAVPTEFRSFDVLARIKLGVPLDAVASELNVLAERGFDEALRGAFGTAQVRTRMLGPGDRLAASTRDALWVLLGAVGLVLLVACSNVANMLLARGASRARELALRAALGAGTWRLVRALFAECLVLALVAGAVGVAFGWLLLGLVVRLRPSSLQALADVQLDGSVLAFTFGIAILTALLFGLAPALQVASGKFANVLRHGASGVVRSGSGARLRKLLVVAQMALSVILLVSAGLLIRSVIYLQSADLGFDASKVFTVQLALPRGRYQQPASRDALSEQLYERVGTVPGVATVTQSFPQPPFGVLQAGILEIRGVALDEADARAPRNFSRVHPDYFTALGILLLEGRTFTAEEADREDAIIINRAAAQRYWPDGQALGAQLKQGRGPWLTVVGIVDNVITATSTLIRDAPIFYSPFSSAINPTVAGAPPTLLLIVRAEEPTAVVPAVRAAIQTLDAEIAISSVLFAEAALESMIAGPRFNMALLTAFAVVALVLAAVGLAAVIGYEVTERTHEFGIRMALGATTKNVRRLALRHGLTPAFVGVVLGAIGALFATRLASSMLHGIAPRDPVTFISVVVLLLLVAFGASWLPARRATRVEPNVALRAE